MRALFGSLAALAAVLLAQNARAEGFSLNYASLSTLEEPLAFRSGQTTRNSVSNSFSPRSAIWISASPRSRSSGWRQLVCASCH